MEKAISNNRIVIGVFGLVFTCITLMYSCSKQTTFGKGTILYMPYQDTILVPKSMRPSTLAKQHQQPTKPLKLPTEEQLQFNKKLNYVLDNAGTSFKNIDLIRGDINDLKSLIIDRAIALRNDNDSLRNAIYAVKSQQADALRFAHDESKARIENERKNMADRLQNEAYKESTITYASFAFGILVILSIIRFVFSYIVYRKQKHLKSHLNYV